MNCRRIPDMASAKRVAKEPFGMRLRGFSVDELFTPEFLKALKTDMPTAIIGHFAIGFSDSKEQVSVSFDVKEGKVITDYVDVGGTDPKPIQAVIAVIEKVIS